MKYALALPIGFLLFSCAEPDPCVPRDFPAEVHGNPDGDAWTLSFAPACDAPCRAAFTHAVEEWGSRVYPDRRFTVVPDGGQWLVTSLDIGTCGGATSYDNHAIVFSQHYSKRIVTIALHEILHAEGVTSAYDHLSPEESGVMNVDLTDPQTEISPDDMALCERAGVCPSAL